MQILEVKNNIAKITYNPSENRLLPADFLLIEDSNQKLIAQIINIETTDKESLNLAVLRLALNIDKEDNLSYYNGYIPAKNSKLIYITSEEIIELIKGNEDNIYFGNLSNHPSCFVKTNVSFLDDRLYVHSDRVDETEIVFKNIISELKNKKKKIIIIDFDGQYSSAQNVLRLKISENIRLPLNIEAFDTILKYDVVDCPLEDKAVIQSIVLELREYLKTLKDKCIPFNMFKQVVDSEFASNPVSGLMLLRNKLWLYAQDGIFADKKEQYDVINSSFFNQNLIILDASDVAEKWYKFIIQTVIDLTDHDSYLFVSLNDVDIDKKSIANLYNKKNIIPIISTSYDSPHRGVLKSLCKNHLLCKPTSILQEKEYYSPLLERMNNGDFLLFGETTLYLPLQIELEPFDADTAEVVVQNEIKRDVDKLLSSPHTVIPTTANVVAKKEEELFSIDDEIVEEIVEEQVEELVQEKVVENLDDITDSDFDFLDEINAPVSNDAKADVISTDDDILNVPFSLPKREDEVEAIMNSISYNVFEPVKEIQKVGVVDEPPNNEVTENVETSEILSNEVEVLVNEDENSAIVEETIIDDETSGEVELVAIDDVIETIENNVSEQVQEDVKESVEENEKNNHDVQQEKELVVELEEDEESVDEEVPYSPPPEINENINTKQTPEIPIYETDNQIDVLIDKIPFKVNDRVYHPKYGKGVIQSFIHYSNNILFSLIDFDDVGRRILDPRISGIERVFE